MNAGKLDRRITIQSLVETQDDFGQPVQTTVVLATVWANVAPLRGKEPFQGEQFNAQQVVVFTVRWRDDVDATMRIEHEGETYDIQSVSEIGRREGLEIVGFALVTA